jgi:hypothetical protein
MIWGDIVKFEDGYPRYMSHGEAAKYCKSIGGRLPSREDFIRLREYMGAQSENVDGYSPQVLPNLIDEKWKDSRDFWSSTTLPDYPNLAYTFGGGNGHMYVIGLSSALHNTAVRCVSVRTDRVRR